MCCCKYINVSNKRKEKKQIYRTCRTVAQSMSCHFYGDQQFFCLNLLVISNILFIILYFRLTLILFKLIEIDTFVLK